MEADIAGEDQRALKVTGPEGDTTQKADSFKHNALAGEDATTREVLRMLVLRALPSPTASPRPRIVSTSTAPYTSRSPSDLPTVSLPKRRIRCMNTCVRDLRF